MTEKSIVVSVDADQFFDWVMEHNLNEVVRFHRTVRSQFHEQYRAHAGDEQIRTAILRYDDHLAVAGLLIYAYVEEYLYLNWQRHARLKERPRRGVSINRYLPILRAIGMPAADPHWAFMTDVAHLRDCLIHANGRLSLMKTQKHMQAIVDRYPGELASSSGRLIVKVEFLKRYVEEVRALRKSIRDAGVVPGSE